MRILTCVMLTAMLAAATAAGDHGSGRAPRLPAAVAAPPGTAALATFTLFGWVAPPSAFTTPERYAELAAAGFNTTVLEWEDPGTVDENLRRLACSQGTGVRNLLLDERLDLVHEDRPATLALLDTIVTAYADDPSFLGWYLGDEPGPERFARLAEWFRLLRARDPQHPAWNNLLGRTVFPTRDAWLGYLRDYVAQVQPSVLCTDHYDHLTSGDRGQFVESVAGTALVAREAGLPFWGILLVTKHFDYRYVDDALLRWQVAQWLSYGARGIGYFTYWTPAPDTNVHWDEGMIRWGSGERSPHYEQVRTLNLRVKPMGETLAGLAWLTTEHAGGTPLGGTAFAPDSLVAAAEGRLTLGTFAAADGTPYLFVANRDSSASRTLVLELVGDRTVARFADAGGWQPWPTAATPRGCRLEVSLAAGDFALFRLSGACGALTAGDCRALLGASPNPATGRVRFAATGVRGGSTLALMDLSGRRVWSRTLSGDAPVIEWDGRDDNGVRVRPGFYWARLSDVRGDVVRRVAWLGAR